MRITLVATSLAAAIGMASLAASSTQAGELCTGPAIPGVPAPADPNTIPNGSSCGLTASDTPILAMFVGFSAADTDALRLPGVSPNPIFINQGSSATPIGTTISLNVVVGGLGFVLDDLSTGDTFTIGTPYSNTDGSSNSVYHFADFTFTTGVDDVADEALYNITFPNVPLTASEFATIEANGGFANWTFAGVEDRKVTATDDWNDLVYAFENVAPSVQTIGVPEPLTLSLFGVVLAGLGLVRLRHRVSG